MGGLCGCELHSSQPPKYWNYSCAGLLREQWEINSSNCVTGWPGTLVVILSCSSVEMIVVNHTARHVMVWFGSILLRQSLTVQPWLGSNLDSCLPASWVLGLKACATTVWLLCIGVLLACMSVQGCQISWDWSFSLELPCGFWKLNPCLLEEQSMLLTSRDISPVSEFCVWFFCLFIFSRQGFSV